MKSTQKVEYVLGVDLGTNSVGWAVIGHVDGEPSGLIRAGVRIFDAGMGGDIGSGRDQSRNLKRRQMRLQRRQTWRRARRLRKVFSLLQRLDLLPPGDAPTAEPRQNLLNEMDRRILAGRWFAAKRASGRFPEPDQTMPYILRAAALDEPLERHHLGRALYHLAQRRGFLSNRKGAVKASGDEEGAVKEGIAKLRQELKQSGARTLGEFFSRLAPSAERIRARWTPRDLYEAEFEAICAAQAPHHQAILSESRKKDLWRAMFYQRPLRFNRNTIGKCELEPKKSRAPAYLLSSQRFRLLQAVNNLEVIPPGGTETNLTPTDRQKLIQALETQGDLTFKGVRKLLGLTMEYGFNLERGGEKSIKGNRTNSVFQGALGEAWIKMPPGERTRLVEYVHAFHDREKLREAAISKWGLEDQAAERISQVSFEADHLGLSRKAIEKLLPLLEDGLTYGEARKLAYPDSFAVGAAAATLPAVAEALPEIRNPAVMRSLTELRKVVNAIVREHGKPVQIRIELARELKKSKKQREAISQRHRRNEASRVSAAKQIAAKAGIPNPSRDDVRKFQLWEECSGVCPYTGRPIPMEALLGPDAQFEIEHILPFSRSMDNSFENLTLCYLDENRAAKGNRTPFEAYAGDPARYEEILERVRHFRGDSRAGKLRRFKMSDEELAKFLENFQDRQLNDTAYASTLAARYLGLLYGGVNDAAGNRRIQATSGQTTAYFRSLWLLNSVLNDGPTSNGGSTKKNREDHRHHAVDAIVIGLTDAAMIKRLADAARRAPAERRRRFASLEAPWHNFVDSIRAEIARLTISHRASKKISGALHEETIYSAPKADGKARVRKALAALTKNEIDDIADEPIKAIIKEKLNGGDPKKVFADTANHPTLPADDGRRIPIKRVRIKKAETPIPVGTGPSQRYVVTGNNHHFEAYAALNRDGSEGRWDGEVVSMYEASQRLRARKSPVRRDHGPLVRFKFSLAPGEVIECDDKRGGRSLFVFRKVTQFANGAIQIGFAPLNDARRATEMQTSRSWLWTTPNTLGERHARKVVVSPLGEVSEAHD